MKVSASILKAACPLSNDIPHGRLRALKSQPSGRGDTSVGALRRNMPYFKPGCAQFSLETGHSFIDLPERDLQNKGVADCKLCLPVRDKAQPELFSRPLI